MSTPPTFPRTASLRYDYLVGKYEVLIAETASRERWGYGIATRFAPDGSPYPYDGALLTDDPSYQPDPNEALVAALSPVQQMQREAALFGSASGVPGAEAEGCTQAVDAEFEDAFPAFTSLSGLEEELGHQTASSPDLAQQRDAWIECMADSGFEVTDPVNPATALDAEVSVLQANGALNDETLAPLRERELNMAAIDWACREPTINRVRVELATDVENEFLERAPDLIEDLESQGP